MKTPQEKAADWVFHELQQNQAREWQVLPSALQDGLIRFVQFGVAPGHFLRSALNDDLTTTVARADDRSFKVLRELCTVIGNYLPPNSHGDFETVQAWINQGGLIGRYAKYELVKLLKARIAAEEREPGPSDNYPRMIDTVYAAWRRNTGAVVQFDQTVGTEVFDNYYESILQRAVVQLIQDQLVGNRGSVKH